MTSKDNHTPSITLRLELFGAFRHYTTEENLEIRLNCGASLSDLRNELERALSQAHPQVNSLRGLIEASAFADEKAVLSETLRLDRDMTIAVLPPVCGG